MKINRINFKKKDINSKCIVLVELSILPVEYTFSVECYKEDDKYVCEKAEIENNKISLTDKTASVENIAHIIAIQAFYYMYLGDELEYNDTICQTVLKKNKLIRKYEIELG